MADRPEEVTFERAKNLAVDHAPSACAEDDYERAVMGRKYQDLEKYSESLGGTILLILAWICSLVSNGT